MNMTTANVAVKYLSTISQTSSKLCRLCNQNMNASTSAMVPRSTYAIHRVRSYSNDANDDSAERKQKLTGLRGIAGKYKIFRDFDSPIILDVDEERELRRTNPEQLEEVVTKIDPYAEMNLEHGKTGVFDIEDLVNVLRLENAQDIVVIAVPAERQYVDYMTIVTGKSMRHTWALAEFVRGLYKRKKYEQESVPLLEGDRDSKWLAMDLGNIALHLFTREARRHYDIELLWSVGHEYDDLAHKKEEDYIQLLEKYTHPAISDLTPANAEPNVASKTKSAEKS